jgi:hypothetical protein
MSPMGCPFCSCFSLCRHLALPRGGVKRSINGHLADASLPSRMLLYFERVGS